MRFNSLPSERSHDAKKNTIKEIVKTFFNLSNKEATHLL